MLASGVTSTVIVSLLSTLKDSEVTKHKSFPYKFYNSEKDGYTLNRGLVLIFVNHKVLNIVKHMWTETPDIQGTDFRLIPVVLLLRLAFFPSQNQHALQSYLLERPKETASRNDAAVLRFLRRCSFWSFPHWQRKYHLQPLARGQPVRHSIEAAAGKNFPLTFLTGPGFLLLFYILTHKNT